MVATADTSHTALRARQGPRYRWLLPLSGGVAVQRSGGAGTEWRGLVLAAVGTPCLLDGVVPLHGDGAAQAAGLLSGAAAALAAFTCWERRMAARDTQPLMNLALFGYRQFAMGSVVSFIYGTALFGSTYLLPVYMQLGLQLSLVGTILLPAGIVLAITTTGVGRLADRHPTYILVSIGLALLAASFGLMVVVGLQTALWVPVVFAILGRIGLGFILPSLNLGSLQRRASSFISQGASVISFARMLGGAAGISLCGMVLEWRLAAHGDSLTNPVASPARLAAFNETFAMLALLCLPCLLALAAALQLCMRKPAASATPLSPPVPENR